MFPPHVWLLLGCGIGSAVVALLAASVIMQQRATSQQQHRTIDAVLSSLHYDHKRAERLLATLLHRHRLLANRCSKERLVHVSTLNQDLQNAQVLQELMLSVSQSLAQARHLNQP